jgi:hypothetical protein
MTESSSPTKKGDCKGALSPAANDERVMPSVPSTHGASRTRGILLALGPCLHSTRLVIVRASTNFSSSTRVAETRDARWLSSCSSRAVSDNHRSAVGSIRGGGATPYCSSERWPAQQQSSVTASGLRHTDKMTCHVSSSSMIDRQVLITSRGQGMWCYADGFQPDGDADAQSRTVLRDTSLWNANMTIME